MKKTTLRSLAFGLAAMLAIVSRAQTIERNMEELFSIADRNNTSIRSCQTAIEKSQQNVEAARSQRLPDVSTSLSVSYIGTGQTLNRDFSYYANPNFPHWGNSFALEAQQVVYAGGALTNGIRLAELGTTMERHNDESNRESVHMLLAGLYLQRMSLLNRLAVVEKNVMLADTLIDKTRNRYEEGVVLRNDITRYELMREQMALQKVVIADRIKIVDKQMHTALYGEAPETPTGIEKHSDIDASILSLPMHDEAYWQDMALTENSNLKKATTSVELSKVQEKMARAASLPKVAITAADSLWLYDMGMSGLHRHIPPVGSSGDTPHRQEYAIVESLRGAHTRCLQPCPASSKAYRFAQGKSEIATAKNLNMEVCSVSLRSNKNN